VAFAGDLRVGNDCDKPVQGVDCVGGGLRDVCCAN
jgi:hypothetical protein